MSKQKASREADYVQDDLRVKVLSEIDPKLLRVY
jgi:hypothetical protein